MKQYKTLLLNIAMLLNFADSRAKRENRLLFLIYHPVLVIELWGKITKTVIRKSYFCLILTYEKRDVPQVRIQTFIQNKK
jgi:hypothetical protein